MCYLGSRLSAFRSRFGVFLFFCGSTAVAAAQPYQISTFAGGVPPATPASALQASIGAPQAVVTESAGTIYFSRLQSVFKLDRSGTITRVAGTGRQGFSGDGGPATEAQLSLPVPYAGDDIDFSYAAGLAVNSAGGLCLVDNGNNRIRKVSQGIITWAEKLAAAPCSGLAGTSLSPLWPSSSVVTIRSRWELI